MTARFIAIVAIAAAAACSGCGGVEGVGRLRFKNQPPVTLVNDRRPIAAPEFRQLGLVEYYFHEEMSRPAVAALTLSRPRPAADVNSLGEVPDSSWFTNRIGVRDLSPAQVRRGPGRGGGPDLSGPWKVDGMKVGGAAIGLKIHDARGDRYIVKFDERDHPETESSADVLVERLVWAFGYNVPENEVVETECDRLVLAEGATFEVQGGDKRPMTQADLDRSLALVRPASGRCRVLASRLLEGVPVGGFPPEGVRTDDANDTVRHEDRRALRGQRLLFAWFDHIDVKTQNTLSVYDPRRRALVHYVLDFGKSLGMFARVDNLVYAGYRTSWGLSSTAKSLFSLGLWVPPWERRVAVPSLRGVGLFDADTFDPAIWTTHHRWLPFERADRFDEYWAATIILKITPAHVRAAVEAARYSDPRAAAYVERILLERRHRLLRWALRRVAPFEGFEVRGGDRFSLCFDDLWVRHRYGAEGRTRYRAVAHDFDGVGLDRRAVWPRRGSRVCLPGLRPGRSHAGYTIVQLSARRGSDEVPDLYVHLARNGRGELAVIGIDRR